MHTDELKPHAIRCFFVFLALAVHSIALPAVEPNKQSSSAEESHLENLEFRAAICAHHLSSGLWVVGRDYQRTPEEVIAQDIAPFQYFGWSPDFKYQVHEKQRLVTVTAPGAPPRSARYTGDQGSTILPRGKTEVYYKPIRVPRNLPNAASQAWPMGDLGATEPVSGVDTEAVTEALDWA
ncbi:MAG TPA: hypothetical protein DIW81_28285, partial [Planctomycetaceae bacterium]|nr:hypothetical protein [Planctomycetaceae bacterium]